jgi:membrane protease YdiL (CAAX protease family)
MPLWLASIVATVAFGLAHAYQGLKALPRITLVGALFTSLYVATGSLLLPIVLHATLDALQGRLAWTVNVRLRPASALDTATGGSPGSRRRS